jgi:hypothetical protein
MRLGEFKVRGLIEGEINPLEGLITPHESLPCEGKGAIRVSGDLYHDVEGDTHPQNGDLPPPRHGHIQHLE